MRYIDHVTRIAGALALCLLLSACESFDLENIFNPKKPLPGERKPVFADGVPGVPQGVPQELVRGYQPPSEPQQQPPVAETPEDKPKPSIQPRPRRTTVAVPTRPPPTSVTVQPSTNPNAPPPPPGAWPAPPTQAQSQQPAQQPTQQSAPPPPAWPAQQSGAQAPSPWPSSPPPGTFSR